LKLVEPEVVATSPSRIKSPVPVYCGLDSWKWLVISQTKIAVPSSEGRFKLRGFEIEFALPSLAI